MWDGRRCAFRQKKGAAGAINSLGMRFAKPSDTWQMIESHIFLAAEKKEENGTPAINHRHSLRPFFCTTAAANPPLAPTRRHIIKTISANRSTCFSLITSGDRGEDHFLFPHFLYYIYIWDIILRRGRTCAAPSFFFWEISA